MTKTLTDIAYERAELALFAHAADDDLADGVHTLADYRIAYESVRTELLEQYPDLDGPEIGDLLGEAAGVVWPSIVHQL
jgi:hypothetical protein